MLANAQAKRQAVKSNGVGRPLCQAVQAAATGKNGGGATAMAPGKRRFFGGVRGAHRQWKKLIEHVQQMDQGKANALHRSEV